jgi:hypothetical protein
MSGRKDLSAHRDEITGVKVGSRDVPRTIHGKSVAAELEGDLVEFNFNREAGRWWVNCR